VRGIHRLHVQLARQCHHLLGRSAVPHHQAGALDAVRGAQRPQLGVHADQAVADELHPPVGARQWVEDGAVEDERAPHLARTAQRVVQRRMVVDPQVAPQPHQGSIQALAHGAECAPVAATRVRG
jgi:hypothetical protein